MSTNEQIGIQSNTVSRRSMLQQLGGGLGLVGLAGVLANEMKQGSGASYAADLASTISRQRAGKLNPLAAKPPHFPAKAKHIIHLFMNGGPSQVDTFDPKPALAKYHGKKPPSSDLKTERQTGTLMQSPFKFHRGGKCGLEVSENYPEVAKLMDDICVIRSMHTNIPNHEPSLLMMNSGNIQPIRPSLGSWLGYGLGTENENLPGYVVLCPGKPVVGPQLWSNSFLPGVYQGCHIQNLRPKQVIEYLTNSYLQRKTQREQLDLIQQLNKQHQQNHLGDDQLDARIQSLEMAFRMQTEAQEAFDIQRESVRVRESYGKGYFSEACLVARRLVERGVRTVQIYYGNGQPWDDHSNIAQGHRQKGLESDVAIAALLRDLKARGLLQDTLVIWGGEFGRTPSSEGSTGRDHNNHGFTMWLSGGGVRGGMAYGATDEFGFAAVDKKVHVHDLHATILHLMGLNHEKLTYRYSGRDFRLTDVFGTIVKDIIA